MTPEGALRAVLIVWLAALAATIVYRLFVGSIRLDGLLRSKRGGEFSPERLQLLIITVAGAATFATESLSHARLYEFPENIYLPLLVGSHSVYLMGKTFRK